MIIPSLAPQKAVMHPMDARNLDGSCAWGNYPPHDEARFVLASACSGDRNSLSRKNK
jgi:hypothetical protein